MTSFPSRCASRPETVELVYTTDELPGGSERVRALAQYNGHYQLLETPLFSEEFNFGDVVTVDALSNLEGADPFAHLNLRASERAERTLERLRAAIAALQARGRGSPLIHSGPANLHPNWKI